MEVISIKVKKHYKWTKRQFLAGCPKNVFDHGMYDLKQICVLHKVTALEWKWLITCFSCKKISHTRCGHRYWIPLNFILMKTLLLCWKPSSRPFLPCSASMQIRFKLLTALSDGLTTLVGNLNWYRSNSYEGKLHSKHNFL